MRCDFCGKEIEQGKEVYHYGFMFHGERLSEPSACAYKFGQKLWQAAKANKEANEAAAREVTEARGDQGEVVDYSGEVGTTGHVRNLCKTDHRV